MKTREEGWDIPLCRALMETKKKLDKEAPSTYGRQDPVSYLRLHREKENQEGPAVCPTRLVYFPMVVCHDHALFFLQSHSKVFLPPFTSLLS